MKAFAIVAVAVTVTAGAASAQTVPEGSYLDTCKSVRMHGSTLSAICETRNGQGVQASLPNAMACAGGIENINGQLVCTNPGQGFGARQEPGFGGRKERSSRSNYPPDGSYRETCTRVYVSDDDLYATCRNQHGVMVPSMLRSFRRLQGDDISNCNGTLRPGRC